ncbi:hypothetical protein [Alteromonas sp. ASW11-130]|uniref:hypothetical protein n=1 Tax=Alteromonas sp. ASW11-130 TaxID=3015775 RepID=UPI0022419402|nr:hypothetical protein [Alteromonas sp. ASW11-130]MCW8091687.1 hypothetical protein [Alteromonas sp. ASW11-130]
MTDFDEHTLLHNFEQLFTPAHNYFCKDLINRCLAVAKQCIEAAQQHPHLVLALLTSKRVETSVSPICLRGTLFLCVTTRRDRFNDHFAQHLIASFICTFIIMRARETNENPPELKSLIQFYQSLGLSIWRETTKIAKLLVRPQAFRHLSSPKLTYRQQYLLSACVVARLLPQHEVLSIFRTLSNRASPALLETLSNWVQFPGMWLPGRMITIGNDAAVILVREKHKIAYLPLPKNAETVKWSNVTNVSVLKSPQSVDFKKLKQWTDDLGLQPRTIDWPYAPSFAINHPPSKLLKIIDLLNGTDTDISLLCEQIKQEPLLARFLRSSATTDNRMNLPVHDVKQAVLTYGLDRVGDMLIQQALNQRLTQKVFPISGLCQRLLTLSADIAAHICFESDTKITPQHASLLLTFAIAPVFSITGLKIALNWRPSSTQLYCPDSLVPAADIPMRQRALQLLSGWHQSRNLQLAVQFCNQLPNQCHKHIRHEVCILGLSLSLAREWLWNTQHYCERTREFKAQAKNELGIDEPILNKIQYQLSQHIWLPINQ